MAMFETEAVVLGMPFFRAVQVAYDVTRRELGVCTSRACADPSFFAEALPSNASFPWTFYFIALIALACMTVLFCSFRLDPEEEVLRPDCTALANDECSSPNNGAGSR